MSSSRARVVAVCFALAAAWGCSNPEVDKVRHVEKGDAYVAEKKDEFAAIEYASAIQLDPKFGEAHWKLAQTYERLGNIRGAFPAYIRAADALPDRRDAQIKAVEVLLLARRAEDAKSRSASLVAKDAKDTEARVLLANAMAALSDVSGALAQIDESLKINPRYAKALVSLGAIRTQQGQPAEAEAAFRQAVLLEPTFAGNRLALATFYLNSKRTAEAEGTLKEVLGQEPEHLLANRMLADLFITTGRIANAEAPLKMIAERSNDPAAKYLLADYYDRASRTKDAVDILTALAKDPRTSAEADTRLAILDYSQGRGDDAHKRIDAVLVRQPKFVRALAVKAEWLARENKLDEALQRAKEAVAADPESAPAFGTLAAIQDRRGETDDAIKSYNEVLRLNPQASGVRAALSRLNLVAGQGDTAQRFADEARRLEPSRVESRVALIRSLLASNNLARAETEAADLVKGAPQAPIAHSLQGLVLLRAKNVTAARAAFARALELAPGFAEALTGLTALDLQSKNSAQAIARLEAELARQPDNVTVLALAAESYAAAGDQAKAEQALKRAVTANPGFRGGYEALARLYVRQNRMNEARAEYEAMSKRDPAATGPRTMVGLLLEMQGQREEAKKWYQQAVDGTQISPVAANNLAYIYAQQGTNLDMALQLATQAKPLLPNDPRVDDTIGWVYYQKGLASLAVGPLEASSRRLPQDPEILYHLGMTYAALGNKVKARDSLTRAVTINPQIGGGAAQKALAAVSQ